MGEFFRGWRRKVGVVTLMVACMFMAMWVRGMSIWPAGEGFELRMELREAGIDFGLVHVHHLDATSWNGSAMAFDIPYASIVIPLTLLSGYLLIIRPRQPNRDRSK
jgi:hypothetical protein